MYKKLNYILVIDVEATCWKGQQPQNQEQEIIEIGICVLDVASTQPLEKKSILVKPERSEVSQFCTELTTLTQEQVNQGVSFEEACKTLKRDYDSHERVWASYGDFDRRQFERQTRSRHIKYPFGISHINVKTLFAIIQGLPEEVGMTRALEQLNLPLEGIHHRGVDDAWNIAQILGKLLQKARG